MKYKELTGSRYTGYTGISSRFRNIASATTGPIIIKSDQLEQYKENYEIEELYHTRMYS